MFETYPDRFDNDPGDNYTVGPDGSQLTNLTQNPGATGEGDTFRYTESSDPVWSPDGHTIMITNDLLIADPFFDRSGLATMKPNGQQGHSYPARSTSTRSTGKHSRSGKPLADGRCSSGTNAPTVGRIRLLTTPAGLPVLTTSRTASRDSCSVTNAAASGV